MVLFALPLGGSPRSPRPGSGQRPPGNVEQEALAEAIIAGDEVESGRKVDRPEGVGGADPGEPKAFQHKMPPVTGKSNINSFRSKR